MISEDKVQSDLSFKDLFKKLWPFVKNHLGLFIVAIISVLIMTVSSRFLPFLIGEAVEKGFILKDYNKVLLIAWLYLTLQIVKMFSVFLYKYLFQKLGNRILFDLREALIKHTLKLPVDYFNKTPTGRTVTRLTTDISQFSELFSDGIVTVFVESLVVLSIIISMSLISIKLTFITLITTPFFIYGSTKINNKIRDNLRELKKKLSELNSYVAESIQGIKIIKLYNGEEKSKKQFFKISDEYKKLVYESIHRYALMMPITNLYNAITIATALFVGGVLTHNNEIEIGLLVTFLLHTQDFIHPLREIIERYQQFQNSLTSAERIFQLFSESEEKEILSNSTLLPIFLEGDIKIKNLSFSYFNNSNYVLKDLSIHIQKHQSIALIGRTGSGKSSLISLIQRFYNPPENTVFIDDNPIEGIPLTLLRDHISVIHQDPNLFRGSIFDNITLRNQSFGFNEVLNAAQEIGYLDLLDKSGRNLSSPVEEKGANLSVGERQLIAFARILVYKPQILILDEATANIDSQTEDLLQKALSKVRIGRTCIIVAHRLSTIKDCSQIFVLDNGQLVEQGDHNTLSMKEGYYKKYLEQSLIDSTLT